MQNNHVDNTFLEETISEWQPESATTFSKEDAKNAVDNIVGFFLLLIDWEKQSDA